MYLRSAKEEAQEAGIETESMSHSVSKLRDTVLTLTGNKVDIMLDSTTLKSTYQILQEISKVWDDMSDIDRASLLESLSGKRNANVTASLISNFEMAEAAVESATNSAGSATAENEKYLESLAGRVTLLKTSFEDLSQAILSSGLFKFLISGLTTAVDGVNSLAKTFGALPTTLGLATAAWLSYQKTSELIIRRNKEGAESLRSQMQNAFSGGFTSSNMKGGAFQYTPGKGVSFDKQSEDVKALQERWKKLGTTISNTAIGSRVKYMNSETGRWNQSLLTAAKNIDKLKQKSAEAMKAGNFSGVTSYTDKINESRNALREEYKRLQANNPDLAAQTKGMYRNVMSGQDLPNMQKQLSMWKQMKGVISDVRTGVAGVTAAEKAAYVTTNLLSVGFKGLKFAAIEFGVALRSAVGMFAIGLVIQGLVTGVMKLSNAAKDAATQAQDVADKSRQISDENREVVDSVDSIVERYKEYGKITSVYATDNAEKRATLIGLQDELNEAVGKEANTIDLINGSYKAQIALLEELQRKKNSEQISNEGQSLSDDIALSRANYKANKSKNFGSIAFDASDKSARRAANILSNSKYSKYFGASGNVINPIIQGDGIESTIDQLKILNEAMEELASNGIKTSDAVYSGLAAYANQLKSELGPTFTDAKEAMNSVIEGIDLNNPFDEGKESLTDYRSEMMRVARASGNVELAMKNGLLSQEDLNSAIDAFLQKNYPEEYAEQITPLKEADAIIKTLFGDLRTEGKNIFSDISADSLRKQIQDSFSDEELRIAYELVLDKEKSFKSIKELRKAVAEELDYRNGSDYTADRLRDTLSGVLGDDNNKSTITSLKKLANTTGIKASDVEDFANKSEELAEVLELDGVSAEYVANILQREFATGEHGAGIASITGKALELNSALNGLEKALDSAAIAKKKYDAEMSKGNSDEGFDEITEAYDKAMSAARSGNTGSGSTDFWAGARYILGEDQLKAMDYSADEITQKLQQVGAIFGNANTAGLGLVQTLQSMADESGNVVINGQKLATVMTDESGAVAIDVRSKNFADLADAIGISEAALTQAINAAKTWADVTTFSSNEVYNGLRKNGEIIDNTKGKISSLADTQIIDTKDIDKSTVDLERFKTELESTGKSFAFLDLQSGAEAALESLEKIGVSQEKVFSDGSGTGKYKIDTSVLNDLLAALGYDASEVEAIYKQLGEQGSMSTDQISDAMEDYEGKVDSAKGSVAEIRDMINSLAGGKNIKLNIETTINGQEIDPNDPAQMKPDEIALNNFRQNQELNPHDYSEEMQNAINEIMAGYDKVSSKLEAKQSQIKSALDFRDAAEYSEEYVQTVQDQIDNAWAYIAVLREQGLSDEDSNIQKLLQIVNQGYQTLLEYDKAYYDNKKAIIEESISATEENPFGDPSENLNTILEGYQEIYDKAAQMRRDAIADGKAEDSQMVREFEQTMRQAINNMEQARRNALSSSISGSELQIDILGRDRHDGESADEIVAIYNGMMAQIEAEMDRQIANGVSANNEYMIQLKKQWYDYRDAARDAIRSVYSEQTAWAKHLTTMQESQAVGSAGKASMIGYWQNEQQAMLNEISNLAAMGYRETDQEIYSLREQVAALNNSIRQTQIELLGNEANYAKHLSTMASYAVNRSGDQRQMIGYWQNEQRALQSQIYSLAAMGFSSTDQEIYSLVEQIEALNDSIISAQASWVNVQSQARRQQASIMQTSHASADSMAAFYDNAWREAARGYDQIMSLGYGQYSSEAMSAYDEYLNYLNQWQDAVKQSLQEQVDVYDYYIKQLDQKKAPFDEYVGAYREQEAAMNRLLNELRSQGYSETSSEIMSLKTQILQLFDDVEGKANQTFNNIQKVYSHKINMIKADTTDYIADSLSIPVLKKQQEEYGKLIQQMFNAGYDQNSDVVMSIQEAWNDVQDQIIDAYKTTMSEFQAISEHRVSMVYDRHNYSFTEYIEEYRSVQQKLHQTAEQYRAMGIDENDELIRELQDQWWDYEDKIKGVYERLVSDADAALGAIKGAYDDFFKAAEDYAQYGTLTYDTFKSLLDLGPEYMSYLKNQNGQLEINKRTMQQVIAARAEEVAINQALNYVESIREARQNENYDTLERLTKGINEAAASTWDFVYASLALIDLTDSEYEGALANLNRYRSLVKQFAYDIDTALDAGDAKSIDDLSGAFDDFVGYVEDMIKAEHDDMKDALDKQLDLYEDIVKKKKEALELAKDEADYEESVADQVKEIAKLQNQIDQLSLDNSREATAKRKKLEDDLAKATKKLTDDQADHALNATKDQLDADKDALSETTKARKEALDEEVSSAEKVHRLAMDRIMQYGEDNLDKLLDEVLAWNLRAGNSLERNIKDTWADIVQLVERYGGLVGAIEAIRANSLKQTVEDVISSGGGRTGTATNTISDGEETVRLSVGKSLYGSTEGQEFKDALNKMIENSIQWWIAKNSGTATGSLKTSSLASSNEKLASDFKEATGINAYKDTGGHWWISGVENRPLYNNQDVGEYVKAKVLDNEAEAINKNNEGYTSELLRQNEEYMKALSNYTGKSVEYKDGVWYYNGKPLRDITTFHKGGVVGRSTIKQDEVMAKLQDGEIILNKERQKGLFKLVDLASYLSDKLGVNLRKGLSLSGGEITQDLGINTAKPTNNINSNFNFAPNINVSISGGDGDEGSARKYARQIADMTLGNLRDAFAQKGMTRALAKA